MSHIARIRAVFRDGAFVPQVPLRLPNESEVELSIEALDSRLPESERRPRLDQLLARMRSQSIQGDPPKLTRDQLHERR